MHWGPSKVIIHHPEVIISKQRTVLKYNNNQFQFIEINYWPLQIFSEFSQQHVTCCWTVMHQMTMFTPHWWFLRQSAAQSPRPRHQMVLVLRRWSTEGQQLPYIRVDQHMHHQMSNTSIPERWNSTKQLKLLFVCAQRLKDCEMNISRVARGAAVTGLGKNHSECWECWYWMKPRFKRQRGNWSWRGTWWLPSFWVAPGQLRQWIGVGNA